MQLIKNLMGEPRGKFLAAAKAQLLSGSGVELLGQFSDLFSDEFVVALKTLSEFEVLDRRGAL